MSESPPVAPAAPASRGPKPAVRAALAAVAIAGVAFWAWDRRFEDTDDAQIDGSIGFVSPRVPGTLAAVRVAENQVVQAGEALAELDRSDYEIAVGQARAALAQAEAAVQTESPGVDIVGSANEASLRSAEADLDAARAARSGAELEVQQIGAQRKEAEARSQLAELDRARSQTLANQGAVSTAELDTRRLGAQATLASVEALGRAVQAAESRAKQAGARLASAEARLRELKANGPRHLDASKASVTGRGAGLDLARAQLAQAERNLGYTHLVAPFAGVIAKKSAALGDQVAPGQQVFAVAQTTDLHVTAAFRETQVRDLRVGQRARLHVDALDLDLAGSVESLGGATGSRLSVLPPENASGNFVKVVQRLPVRIRIEAGQPGVERLRIGMSVEAKVTVR